MRYAQPAVLDPDFMAANRAAGTLKDLREKATEAREEGRDEEAAEYEADAEKIILDWQGTRFDVEQMSRGV